MTQRTPYMLSKTKTAKNNTQLHMLAGGSLKKMGGEWTKDAEIHWFSNFEINASKLILSKLHEQNVKDSF